MAHAALTDVANKHHYEGSRLARGHPSLAGVTAGTSQEPFGLWLEDWRLQASVAGSTTGLVAGLDELALHVRSEEFAVQLELLVEKPVVLQGDRGLSYKGSREASYYYSVPRLSARGLVQTVNAPGDISVMGACWLDREWSTSVLADNLVGWDWFALQFNDRSEMMLFQLREGVDSADAEAPVTSDSQVTQFLRSRHQGKQISPDGTAIALDGQELQFEPLRYWQDETGARWPIEWRIAVSDRELRIVAALDDQKMRSSIEYWEGLVWVYDGERRIGQGYLEMTGYTQDAQGAARNG